MPTHHFDPFVYETESFRLTGPDGPIALEPKVAELLALLIHERDRVVSRAEIFDALWPNQSIGDAALSRLLYELRKALGDSAADPRFVRTVPRRGMQFVGTLGAPAPGLVDPPADETPASLSGETPQAGSRPPFIWAAIALVIIAGVLLLGLRQRNDSAVTSADVGDTVRLAILTGVGAGAGNDASMVMVTVTDLLWNRLQALTGVEVRSPLFAEAASASAKSVTAFARDSQVDYVLSLSAGSSISDDWVRVRGELIQMRDSGEPLRTPMALLELPRPASDEDLAPFLEARESMVRRVAEEIGVLIGSDVGFDAPQNLEAWRLYLKARSQIAELRCDTDGAASLLERALELDPDLSPAWRMLAAAKYNKVWACGAGREAALEALAVTQQARALDPNSASIVAVEGALLAELGRSPEAEQLAREYLARYPGDAITLDTLSYALTFQGRLQEAAEALRGALAADPLVLEVETGGTPTALLHLQRWDEYLQLGPTGDSPVERFYRAYAFWQAGDGAAALDLAQGCQQTARAEVFGDFCRMLNFSIRGESANLKTLLQAMLLERRQDLAMDGEIDFKLAQYLALADQPGLALEAAGMAWNRGFHCRYCFENDPLLEPLRVDASTRLQFEAIFNTAP